MIEKRNLFMSYNYESVDYSDYICKGSIGYQMTLRVLDVSPLYST